MVAAWELQAEKRGHGLKDAVAQLFHAFFGAGFGSRPFSVLCACEACSPGVRLAR
jgi:hypothetical protein